jgi:succinyl-CoA synthetase beta subunit
VIAHQVLIAPPVDIEKEYYLGAIVDRNKAEAVLIAIL